MHIINLSSDDISKRISTPPITSDHSPGHDIQDGREPQRGPVFPAEGVLELAQAAAHGAAAPAAAHHQARPEVHLGVPVHRVHVPVALEFGEQEVHALVVVPLVRQLGQRESSGRHAALLAGGGCGRAKARSGIKQPPPTVRRRHPQTLKRCSLAVKPEASRSCSRTDLAQIHKHAKTCYRGF